MVRSGAERAAQGARRWQGLKAPNRGSRSDPRNSYGDAPLNQAVKRRSREKIGPIKNKGAPPRGPESNAPAFRVCQGLTLELHSTFYMKKGGRGPTDCAPFDSRTSLSAN